MPESALRELIEIILRLRGPDGCPWDREQTLADLGRYVREEAEEVEQAIGAGEPAAIAEELGDLLFNVLHAVRIAEEQDLFDLRQVLFGVRDKIVRRHPHVFGDAEAKTTEEVLDTWERVKAEEKRKRNEDRG
jgi:uncharacterized protein YabN with tetrapyrrole methylase and pyrophosphatase domain